MFWAYRQVLYAVLAGISLEYIEELRRSDLLAAWAQGSACEKQHKIQLCLLNRIESAEKQEMETERTGSARKQPFVVLQPPANVTELP